MALTLQDDTGTVTDANAYIDAVYFKAYHDARGGDYSAYTDEQIEKAIIRSTDYLDTRFRFVGYKLNNRTQSTEWPRRDAEDRDDNLITDIPREVKEATAEYAMRALAASLVSDPARDTSGRFTSSESVTVGPISEAKSYAGMPSFSMPVYPAADRKLMSAGIIRSSGELMRG